MARPLKNGQVLADPVGAPDFTLPVSILAQIIESLKVDITAQSIPTLNINIASISQGVTVTTTVSNMPSTFPLPSDQIDTLKQITIQNVATGLLIPIDIKQVTATLNIANFPSVYPLPSDQISALQQVTIQNIAAGLIFNVNIAQVTATLNIANFPSSYPLPDAQVSALKQITIQNVAAGLYIPINIAKADATINSNATISGVVAGVYVPITIHSVESGVIFNINISSVSAGVTFNVNISSITSGVVFNVAQSGTWTVNAAQSGTWTINIGAPLDANGNLKTSIQSSVQLNVNIAASAVTLNVNISSVTSGVTFNVNVTNATLTVVISGTPTVNIQTSGGANIVIDKLTQGAYTERRSDIYNHGATPTMVANNYTYKRGKFFPRGCRGFLHRVWIYCDNPDTAAHTLTVKFSPAPGMGAVYTVTASVAAGSSAAWRYIDVKKFWNYDSMFIWASFDINAYGRLGYDTGTPYDYYVSIDEATWTPDNYRYWIYVTISGETVGDLPVSGTLNTIRVPALSSKYAVSSAYVPQNTETIVLTVNGAGECDMIICRAHTNTYSHVTEFRIYCDGILAFQYTPDNLNTLGFTSSSPGISLLKFAANGDCIFVITKRFGFRSFLRVAAYNAAGAAAVSVSAFANLIS